MSGPGDTVVRTMISDLVTSPDLLFKIGWSGFSLLFVIVGLFTANRGRKSRARSGRIADTETTPVRDLQPGTVEVKGTAHPAEGASPIESPITEADALASHVEIEKYQSSNQGSGSWKTIHEERDTVPMVVDDGTGRVRVELPPDGKLNLDAIRTRVSGGEEPPKPIQRFVEQASAIDEAARRDIGPLSLGERRRYSEGVIEPGEEVYLLGRAREEQAGWGEREHVIDEPTPAGDFILSDKSEEELVKSGRWGGAFLLGFGGLFAGVGALFAIIPWLVL
jgi:hypothetical protein